MNTHTHTHIHIYTYTLSESLVAGGFCAYLFFTALMHPRVCTHTHTTDVCVYARTHQVKRKIFCICIT